MTAQENPPGRVIAEALRTMTLEEWLVSGPTSTFAAEGVVLPDGATLYGPGTRWPRRLRLPSGARACRTTDECPMAAPISDILLLLRETSAPGSGLGSCSLDPRRAQDEEDRT